MRTYHKIENAKSVQFSRRKRSSGSLSRHTRRVVFVASVVGVFSPLANATELYFDNNGAADNTGTGAAGAWNGSAAIFNSDSTGGAGGTVTAATTNADPVHFSSGSGYTGAFTVTISGTQAANSILFEEGAVTVAGTAGAGNVLDMTGGTGGVDVAASTGTLSVIVQGSSGITKTGSGVLNLTGANTFTGGLFINAGSVRGGASATDLGTGSITLGAAGSADAMLSGSNVTRANAITLIGNTNTGTLRIAGGGSVAQTPTFSGAINLNGHDLTVGNGAASTSGVTLSGQITGSNNLIFDNSNALVTGAAIINNAGNATSFTGNLIINAAAATNGVQASSSFGAATSVSLASGTKFTLGASTVAIGGLTGAGGIVSSNGSSSRTLNLIGTSTYSFAGSLQNNAAAPGLLTVNKTGSGTQTLTGTNTYTGNTSVAAGSLIVGTGGSITSAVSVSAGTFGGSGSSSAAVTIGNGVLTAAAADSFLAPGDSGPGTFTTTSTLALGSDSTFNFEINSTTGAADKTVANGVTLNASALFSFVDVGNGSGVSDNQVFLVIDDTSGGAMGTFANLAEGATFLSNSITYTASYTGGSGNDLVLTATVPEPAGAGLLALSSIALIRRRRRSNVVG